MESQITKTNDGPLSGDQIIQTVSIDEINQIYRQILIRFRIAVVTLAIIGLVIFVGIGWGLVILRSLCWYGWFGTGPIEVIDRYYFYKIDEQREYHFSGPGEERKVDNENLLLGIRLSLKKECQCSDLFGEVHNYVRGESERFVETPLGGGELLPQNGDLTSLRGEWIRPPPDERYRLEVRLKCRSRPNENIGIFNFATFNLKGGQ